MVDSNLPLQFELDPYADSAKQFEYEYSDARNMYIFTVLCRCSPIQSVDQRKQTQTLLATYKNLRKTKTANSLNQMKYFFNVGLDEMSEQMYKFLLKQDREMEAAYQIEETLQRADQTRAQNNDEKKLWSQARDAMKEARKKWDEKKQQLLIKYNENDKHIEEYERNKKIEREVQDKLKIEDN